ncbi:MAG TPA: helix-turn-helix domain-containing protein [Myxococcales bacterium]|jgi:DNA-binding HxlR family transcriptional regulator|nr:helix-turn-helix domain-containing protein [Myxococcales bacterium]
MPDLVPLFHRQWSLAALTELKRGGKPQASRQTLNATFAALAEQGLVEKRESGYALTRRGERVADRAEALLTALQKLGGEAPRKWALPVVHALVRKPLRFGELKTALHGTTPRALSMALKDVIKSGLVERRIVDGFPPRSEYALGNKARSLAPLLEALSKA